MSTATLIGAIVIAVGTAIVFVWMPGGARRSADEPVEDAAEVVLPAAASQPRTRPVGSLYVARTVWPWVKSESIDWIGGVSGNNASRWNNARVVRVGTA
jgi:hypothetical protein